MKNFLNVFSEVSRQKNEERRIKKFKKIGRLILESRGTSSVREKSIKETCYHSLKMSDT